MVEVILAAPGDRSLRPAVLRALRLIQAHPAVVKVTIAPSNADGTVQAVVDVRSELANAWRAAGISPSGVREIEPVSFVFTPNFPLFAPLITFRSDFNRGHPHLQPSPSDLAPQPCLIAGSPRELLRLRGMEGLFEQLVSWLDKAATLDLINPQHGWEPVRRDYLDDIIVADASWLTSLPTNESRCVALNAHFFVSGSGQSATYAISLPKGDVVPLDARLASRWHYSAVGELGWRGNTHALVVWSGKRPNGQAFIADQYLPETVGSIDDLLTRATDLGCREVLETKLNLIMSRLVGKQMAIPQPIAVVLLARRPFDVSGTSSPLELCPYVIEIRGSDALSRGSGTAVRIAMHRDEISPQLLRRASGDPAQQTRPWTLLGCGSVGSKIALHLARTGCAPASLIDRAYMLPHNYARHATLPSDEAYASLDMVPKTRCLAGALRSLGQVVASHEVDLVGHIAQNRSMATLLAPDGFALVNTTGSASVREALCLPDVTAHRPRAVEACLLGVGRVGLVTVEGPDTNPSSTDLMCEAYRLIHAQSGWREEVFSTEGEAIAIGQGCSAVTMPLSDARLSALVAPMAEQIRGFEHDGLPRGGAVLLGHIASDGLNQAWQRTEIPPRLIVGDAQGITVRLSPTVDATIRREVANRPGSETGGILIGTYSDVGNCFHVVDSLPAPPDSRFSRDEFVLGTEGLKPLLRNLVEGSGGALYVLGTWHNHLRPSGPSSLDMHTGIELALRQYFPVLLLIHTPTGYTRLIVEALHAPATTVDLMKGSGR